MSIAILIIIGVAVGGLVVPVAHLITAKATEIRCRAYKHVDGP